MYDIDHRWPVTILTVTSKLEGLNRLVARRQLDELLAEGSNRLVLDLTHLRFLDSSGLGSVVVAFHRARAAGGDLCLCGVNQTIRQVLEMTLLHQIVPVFESVEAAVEALAPKA
jgi:anti-sigma B factor antagonist